MEKSEGGHVSRLSWKSRNMQNAELLMWEFHPICWPWRSSFGANPVGKLSDSVTPSDYGSNRIEKFTVGSHSRSISNSVHPFR
jgi:hypothetical protein